MAVGRRSTNCYATRGEAAKRKSRAMRPLPTGSATIAKTMGIVRVCRSSAAVVGLICERNEIRLQRNEFLCESLHRLHVERRPASLDPDVAPLYPPRLLEPFRKAAKYAWASESFSAVRH